MRYILLFLALAACANPNTVPVTTTPGAPAPREIALVSTGISDAMRDPESTRFRRWRAWSLSNGDRVICGEVNARNGFGAYTGYSPFFVRLTGGTLKAMQIDRAAALGCAQAASGRMAIMPN